MTNQEKLATGKPDGKPSSQVVLSVCDDLFGQAVADFAGKYSWQGDPVFHMLFVVEIGGLPAIAPDLVPEIEKDERQYGRDLIAGLSKKITGALPNATIVAHIVKGSPASAILELADSVHADMIVLGSHGRTGLRKLLLGSVSEAVVANSKCSTMIVRVANADERLALPGPAGLTTADLPAKMTTYVPVEEPV